MTPDAPQREHSLREVLNATRWIVHTGASWRYLPGDFPRWQACCQQTQRWLRPGSFEAIVHDLRELVRVAEGRNAQPPAVVLDARTLQSTPEPGGRAGYDGHKGKRGSKTHIAVDTLGHLLAKVTPANEQERSQVTHLAQAVQDVTGKQVDLAYVDQGYTGEEVAEAAAEHGIQLEVVKLPAAKRGFVLLPRRWVVERSFAWASRFRRLARDYERLPETLVGLHFVAFVCLLLQKAAPLLQVHNTLKTHYTFRRPSSYVLQIVSATAKMETWECPRGLDARSAIWWLPGDGGVSAGTHLTDAERG